MTPPDNPQSEALDALIERLDNRGERWRNLRHVATLLLQMGEALIDARERTVCRLTPWLYSRDCACEPCAHHREYATLIAAFEAYMKEGK